MQNPIAVQSSEFSTSLSAEDQEEYESLQKVYLEKRVRTGADAELPANGMRLRRQQRQARINAPHYARLKKKLQLLMKRHNHVESFRLLSLLRDYETKQLGFLPYDLMPESGKQTTNDNEVVEVIEIDDSEDEDDRANFIDLEILDGDNEDKDRNVSAGPNQNMHIAVKVEDQVEEQRTTKLSNMELPENEKCIVFSQFQNFTHIMSILEESKTTLEEVYNEYLCFMKIKIYNKSQSKSYSPSIIVYAFWHAHILCTYQYAGFCDEWNGSFIHHSLSTHKLSTYEAYCNTLEAYDTMFASKAPRNVVIWSPPSSFSSDEGTVARDSLNDARGSEKNDTSADLNDSDKDLSNSNSSTSTRASSFSPPSARTITYNEDLNQDGMVPSEETGDNDSPVLLVETDDSDSSTEIDRAKDASSWFEEDRICRESIGEESNRKNDDEEAVEPTFFEEDTICRKSILDEKKKEKGC